MEFSFALVGNPNSGKTTLFNQLTGSKAHVGNWPGVTVEKKEGKYRIGGDVVTIVDLPGIYSLTPYSEEEVVARDFIIKNSPDLVINIVDATNLERNLYLSSQIIETKRPMVIALNMMDEIDSRGDSLDIEGLSKSLGVPVIPISASKGSGIKELMAKSLLFLKNRTFPMDTLLKNSLVNPYISELAGYLKSEGYNMSCFETVKVMEKDELALGALRPVHINKVNEMIDKWEKELNGDFEIIIADERYKHITSIVSQFVTRAQSPDTLTASDKIDLFVTNKYLAFPIFIVVMYMIFQLSVGVIGPYFTNMLDVFFNETLASQVASMLELAGASDWAISLVVDGVIGGVGSIMTFLPQIILLFLALSFLEDSGYMARIAFIMDKPLHKVGLSGKAFVPMVMGFGCSVPAIMAARTLENEVDRKTTIILAPFMSCSARLPIYIVFTSLFFQANSGMIIFSLYMLGIAIALISGVIIKKYILKGEAPTFIMELPPYRLPSLKSTLLHMWEKVKDFIVRAGTVILAAMIVIWFVQNFTFTLQPATDDNSIAVSVGKLIAPIFAPLGFGTWQATVALFTGFVAKEAVVGTLEVLYGGDSMATAFTALSAYSFMVFSLLYMPCVAAFATIIREMNSKKWTAFAVLYQTGIAWLMAFIIYQAGSLIGL